MGSGERNIVEEPLIQLDAKDLDIVELALGGLVDLEPVRQHLTTITASVASPGLQDADELRHRLRVADPDGTPLARAVRDQENGLVQLQALRAAEHGPCRDSRITTPLPGQRVILLDGAAATTQLLQLREEHQDLGDLTLLLVASSSQAAGPDYPGLMEQLHAGTRLVGAKQARHLIVPDDLAVDDVIDRLSVRVVDDLRQHRTRSTAPPGTVVMFSGLSGSGKSTLARAVQERIRAHTRRRAVLLDGDDIRRFVSKGLGFSREDRETNVQRIGWIAARISEAGGIALCAPIAPFAEARAVVRELAEEVGSFTLIHVSTPLEVCEQRDRKGLYAKARAGQIPDFTGIDSPYEVPSDAELTLDLAQLSIQDATARVIQHLRLP